MRVGVVRGARTGANHDADHAMTTNGSGGLRSWPRSGEVRPESNATPGKVSWPDAQHDAVVTFTGCPKPTSPAHGGVIPA